MIAGALCIAGIAINVAGLLLPFERDEDRYLAYVVGDACFFLANVIDGNVIFAVFFGLAALWELWMWWRRGGGKRSKKAARELGAKSRARVDALVEQMTPSPIPSLGGAS